MTIYIVSEEAVNRTASVQPIQPVLPFSTMDNASDSTSITAAEC